MLHELVRSDSPAGRDNDQPQFCDACFTGRYPVEVPLTLRKHVLEDNEMPTSEDIIQPALDGTTA